MLLLRCVGLWCCYDGRLIHSFYLSLFGGMKRAREEDPSRQFVLGGWCGAFCDLVTNKPRLTHSKPKVFFSRFMGERSNVRRGRASTKDKNQTAALACRWSKCWGGWAMTATSRMSFTRVLYDNSCPCKRWQTVGVAIRNYKQNIN